MTDANFIIDGEHASGLTLGPRPSGVTLASAGGRPLHVLLPEEWRYAPALAALVTRLGEGVRPAGDRLRIDPSLIDAATAVAEIEAVLASGERGGIREHSVGPYRVALCPEAWAYRVTTTPAGRPSLKRIGVWTGKSGEFDVPFERESDLAVLLGRAADAVTKTETTTVRLPTISGMDIKAVDGEIRISGKMREEFIEIIRSQRGMRWNRALKAWVVSARYAKSTEKTLNKIKLIVDREQEIASAQRREAALADAAGLELLTPEFLAGTEIVREGGEVATAYHPEIVQRLRDLGGKWSERRSVWVIPGRSIPALVEQLAEIERLHKAALDQRAALQAERTQAARDLHAKRSAGRFLVDARSAPRDGETVELGGAWRTITGLGKIWRIDSEDSSAYGVSPEGGPVRYVYTREATEAEATEAKAAKTEAEAAAQRRRAESAAVAEVFAGELSPSDGGEPIGDILWRDDSCAASGFRRWIVEADGWLYGLTYKGGDGDAWGEYNCGYNTVGTRVRTRPDLVSLIRAAQDGEK